MTELKSCPFCGGTDIHIVENGPDGFSITCKDCNAWVDNIFEDMTKEEAIELWNRRVKKFQDMRFRGERDMKDIEEYEEEDYESDLKKDLLAKGKLKSCPFCGKKVELKHYNANGNDWWYVACSHCEIAMDPLMWNTNRTKKEAVEIWNRRVKG